MTQIGHPVLLLTCITLPRYGGTGKIAPALFRAVMPWGVKPHSFDAWGPSGKQTDKFMKIS